MAYTSSGSSSSSDSDVDSCSKTCLESVEARLAHYKKNETMFEESIKVLNLEVKLRDNALLENKKKLEKAEKERDELKLTLEKFQNSYKSLNNLLKSQVSDKLKTGLGYNAVKSFVNSSEMLENHEYNKSKSDKGYHAVPPPYTGNYIPPKPDLMFLDEIVESESVNVVNVVTPSNVKTVESKHESVDVKTKGIYNIVEPKTVRKNNFGPPIIKDWNSNDESEVDVIPKKEEEGKIGKEEERQKKRKERRRRREEGRKRKEKKKKRRRRRRKRRREGESRKEERNRRVEEKKKREEEELDRKRREEEIEEEEREKRKREEKKDEEREDEKNEKREEREGKGKKKKSNRKRNRVEKKKKKREEGEEREQRRRREEKKRKEEEKERREIEES
ncbi:hypothetical protein Tco_1404852 [Tanacetum coccineum]